MLETILIGVAGVLVLFGSPLEKADPGMQKTFEGPAAGVGQSYAWSGNILGGDLEKGLAQLKTVAEEAART